MGCERDRTRYESSVVAWKRVECCLLLFTVIQAETPWVSPERSEFQCGNPRCERLKAKQGKVPYIGEQSTNQSLTDNADKLSRVSRITCVVINVQALKADGSFLPNCGVSLHLRSHFGQCTWNWIAGRYVESHGSHGYTVH